MFCGIGDDDDGRKQKQIHLIFTWFKKCILYVRVDFIIILSINDLLDGMTHDVFDIMD